MGFPDIRMRERRKDEATRKKYREIAGLSVGELIMPIFVKESISAKKEIKSMPGIYQLPVKDMVPYARTIYNNGIPAVILFGIPGHKDEIGSSAYDDKGVVQEAIRLIKKKVPGLSVIADVCMCEYTSHGHCGLIKKTNKGEPRYEVDNDATIEVLARIALSYAKAGVDVVAPSAMMDGQVRAIKKELLRNNCPKVKIMAYSAKYASGFYAPFRDAAESPPQFGDRKTYQMDCHNSDEAVLEAKLDIEEGADTIMVKPALGYEDIIYRLKKELKFPLACYSVSGEYAMFKSFFRSSILDSRFSSRIENRESRIKKEMELVSEVLTGFKRAGADMILTYYALEVAKWLKSKR